MYLSQVVCLLLEMCQLSSIDALQALELCLDGVGACWRVLRRKLSNLLLPMGGKNGRDDS